MALEDRGIERDMFMKLQEREKAKIYLSSDSLEIFREQLRNYGLGGKYHLGFILEQLIKLGLDFKDSIDKKPVKSAFFECLLRFTIHHALREVKFKARIPIPNSYRLVGVADEGRAYVENEGFNEDDVYTLKPGTIYGTFHRRLAGARPPHAYDDTYLVCVQETVNEQAVYLKGNCVISRSPVIHPGDGTYINVPPSSTQLRLILRQCREFGQWASRRRTRSAFSAD
jgi:RNA-dependent RNA polymerase